MSDGKAELIVEHLLTDMRGRKGFRQILDEAHPSIRAEIRTDWLQIVREVLAS